MVDTNDLFKRLRVGTCFNGDSNKQVLDQFASSTQTQIQLPTTDPEKALDFFDELSHETVSSGRKRKKNKSPTEVIDSAEDVDSIQLLSTETTSRVKKRREQVTQYTPLPDQSALLRKRYKIHVKGSDIPAPHDTFQSLHDNYSSQMPSCLLDNLIQSGFMSPTPIQMQAVPLMMHNRDVLCCAPTGSGKTAAFVLPILSLLREPQRVGFRALVLTFPPRELAAH